MAPDDPRRNDVTAAVERGLARFEKGSGVAVPKLVRRELLSYIDFDDVTHDLRLGRRTLDDIDTATVSFLTRSFEGTSKLFEPEGLNLPSPTRAVVPDEFWYTRLKDARAEFWCTIWPFCKPK